MRVFVTGATGFIGSAVVRELIDAGHHVTGLARSDQAAASLRQAGAEVHRGALEDPDSLHRAAGASDGVIHTAFIHNFEDFPFAAQTDRRAIETLGEALTGSDRPFVVSSGIAGLTPGRLATEQDAHPPTAPRFSEVAAIPFAARGVRASAVRLPPSVHGDGDKGFVPRLIAVARERGVSAYVGDGSNRWSAVHRLDAAHLFRLALEAAPAGARLHGIGDEGVPLRDIAAVIGRRLNLPVVSVPAEQAGEHFGWLGFIAPLDMAASSTLTQKQMGWHPVQPGLIADLQKDHYFNG